jgi:hypothetical protein
MFVTVVRPPTRSIATRAPEIGWPFAPMTRPRTVPLDFVSNTSQPASVVARVASSR